jgi:hypothetical protein
MTRQATLFSYFSDITFEGGVKSFSKSFYIEDNNCKQSNKRLRFAWLTLYHARYSWATIADGLDISEKTISKGLGHVAKSMAGRKYIAFDWSKVDRANRQVIDFVLEK